ncbi:MAG: hypothetical protein JWR15_3629 [Prosthecobacter sp.]|nr:hypothetical protein [Prosthecobacter sp.]
MTLQVPDKIATQADCTAADLIFGMVIGLFYQGRLSLGQAGEALGLSKPDMMQQLHEHGLPMSYSAEDAAKDLVVINQMFAQAIPASVP